MLPDLLHGAEKKVQADADYQGPTEAIHAAIPEEKDMTSRGRNTRTASVIWNCAKTPLTPECERKWGVLSAS